MVTTARNVSTDASGNAPAYGGILIQRLRTCSGMVLCHARGYGPLTTDTAPNSPIARALHKMTP